MVVLKKNQSSFWVYFMFFFAKSRRLAKVTQLRLGPLIFWLLMASLQANPPPGAQFLAPPSLPPSLPGGANLPNLPPGAQREILARALEAAMAPPSAPRAPRPIYPASKPSLPKGWNSWSSANSAMKPSVAVQHRRRASVPCPVPISWGQEMRWL